MARIRTIKPEFFTSEDIVELEPLTRLLYIALWCEADKEGRMAWKPKTFKMRYFPVDNCDIDALADALVTRGLVVLYGDGYAFIPTFKDHQHINPREKESCLPVPDDASGTRQARVTDAPVTEETRAGRKGKEGKGKEDASKRVPPPKETLIPDDFAVSAAVSTWAGENGYDRLEAHLSHFVDTAKAKGYKYRDWDAAFRNAIKGNWAKLKDHQRPSAASGYDPNELIDLPDGRQITRAQQAFLKRMGV